MKLRLPGVGRRKRGAPRQTSEGKRAQAERDEAMRRMKDRVADSRPAPEPEDVRPAVLQAPPDPTPAKPDPALEAVKEAAEPASVDPLKAVADAAGDDGGADLLDLFMEAKAETDEISLAAELDDVGIGDLLGEIQSVGDGLGVNTGALPDLIQRVEQTLAEAAAKAPEPPAPVDSTPPVTTIHSEPPAPAAPLDDETDAGILHVVPMPVEEPTEPEPEPEPLPVVKRVEPPEEPVIRTSAPRSERHGYYLVVIGMVGFGLAMTTSLGIGLARASESPEGNTAALSIVTFPAEPAVGTATIINPEPVATPEVGQAAFKPPTTPTPEPDDRREVAPDPEPVTVPSDRPAFFTYEVESGDSLTSIAIQFGICPDHILWNNRGRLAGGSLKAGMELMLPGYPGLIHVVRGGDSVQRLAKQYNTTEASIIAYPGNSLKSAGDLEAGDVILLPGAFPASVLDQTEEGRIAYAVPSSSGYIWPFYGPITTLYGEQRPGYVHTAIDIGGLYKWGAPVYSIAPGKVVSAVRDHPGLGNYVIVVHDDGARSLYAHLADFSVSQGQSVDIGSRLGALGCTGNSTGTHLHFELWKDGRPVDPLQYLSDPQQAPGAE